MRETILLVTQLLDEILGVLRPLEWHQGLLVQSVEELLLCDLLGIEDSLYGFTQRCIDLHVGMKDRVNRVEGK